VTAAQGGRLAGAGAISADGAMAIVPLAEPNGLGVIDLYRHRFTTATRIADPVRQVAITPDGSAVLVVTGTALLLL
jgi:hypothetical protein